MKTDFTPKLQYIPLLPVIGAGAGLIQGIFGHSKAKKAERALENLQTPTYQTSGSIMDYYNKALQRFNTNPYQSQAYQYATNQAARSTAAGINALGDRRSAVGGIGRLAALQNDAALKAGAMAEGEQNQRFNELGQAAGMKTADDRMAFQYNKIAPFEKKYNLLSMKAGAGNEMMNAGINNIFGAIGAAQDTKNINKIYGQK